MTSAPPGTDKALILLTIAHETFKDSVDGAETPPTLDDDTVSALLAGDDGEINWRDIALGLGMLGHLLLESVPNALYDQAELALAKSLEEKFNLPPDAVSITFETRLTGTALLQQLSLHLMTLDMREGHNDT